MRDTAASSYRVSSHLIRRGSIPMTLKLSVLAPARAPLIYRVCAAISSLMVLALVMRLASREYTLAGQLLVLLLLLSVCVLTASSTRFVMTSNLLLSGILVA